MIEWVDTNSKEITDLNDRIWRYCEPGLREYKSAKDHCKFLSEHGFAVEEGIAGLPTAFMATWGEGKPVIGTFAEYDATPERSQDAVPYPKPIVPFGPGFTDAHHTLGVGSVSGIIAAKMAMYEHGLKGTLKIFGTPAEKICIGKPWQAAKGYYDNFDAFVVWHPGNNTVDLKIHAGSCWSGIVEFELIEPEKWPGLGKAPAAVQAANIMVSLTTQLRTFMIPNTGLWRIEEWIMVSGQTSADSLPPKFSQIKYYTCCPTLVEQEAVWNVIKRCADAAALVTQTKPTIKWITKTRTGLPNITMSELVWRNMKLIGPPIFSEKEKEFARKIQKNMGFEPLENPLPDRLIPPQDSEAETRKLLPPLQQNRGCGDYTEFTWHAPTGRFNVACTTILPPKAIAETQNIGDTRRYYYNYSWGPGALCGTSTTHKGAWTAAKIMGCSMIELITDPSVLTKAKAEFNELTGGGVDGSKWIAPLLSNEVCVPTKLRWPEWSINTYPITLDTEKRTWSIPY